MSLQGFCVQKMEVITTSCCQSCNKTVAERFNDGADFVTKHLVGIFLFDRHCFCIRTKKNYLVFNVEDIFKNTIWNRIEQVI